MKMEEIFYEGGLCPVCEVGALALVNKEIEFDYKDNKMSFKRDILECETCRESFFQPHDEDEIEKALTDRRRKVDGLLTSDEIRIFDNNSI